ncbi:type I-MYXAN CRISPR-associated endonuclease Cas4/Cas1 [Lyngbya sp. CCY1209]|uniref:type I-MYXAN CRISPR-associated endonuclease Cas4/Cas1 n=1 Tax=Lyngbya sp. CCY1209 TaxID=2886103 RepID=UPI002D202951|nr:type I-MYXAN CRISPR-associated endonuclease Cas1 [Lyngbya sp. CCY1209]MEB3884066.1 type I-MYXAN CRISPR-associated endonuclease Cas1 [Lyngbya sp. CCY1209]
MHGFDNSDTLRVCALHAMAYCPRLFYLEEVEELYVQNRSVFEGRRLHAELERLEDGEWEDLFVADETLGLRGRVDALRLRSGELIPYEHKKGRSCRDERKQPRAWESDRLQILAYCCLLETVSERPIREGRIRYHGDNTLVKVPFDGEARKAVEGAVERARSLRESSERPPVADNEKLCQNCSLSPVCLPEETRFVADADRRPQRLFPADDDRQVLHVLESGSRVGRTGERLKVTKRDRSVELVAVRQVSQVVLHGFSQISTQALHLCQAQDVGIHWISGGGRYVGSLDFRRGSIQRRRRQYEALGDRAMCLELAKRLVACRGRGQRQFLMRGKRGLKVKSEPLESVVRQMKVQLANVGSASSPETLLGMEGNLAALYFSGLSRLVSPDAPLLQFENRNRRPPKDRFNALLSFGYALLLKDVTQAILSVGLEPSLGFYHRPRTQASPLALDLMEIFRVLLVDMPVLASVNRGQWDATTDFDLCDNRVWLSDRGRRKFVEIYERRKAESWKHPVLQYSLTYRRLLELEVRLLEKEWSGESDVFARLTIR